MEFKGYKILELHSTFESFEGIIYIENTYYLNGVLANLIRTNMKF